MYSYMLKLQSPSKYSLIYAIYLSGNFFSSARNSFWTHWFACILGPLPFLLFHFFHIGKTWKSPLRTFFIWGNRKKATQGETKWIERGEHGVMLFWVKNCWTQCSVGRCTRKSPIMKRANALKESSKKIHWSQKHPLTTMPAGTLIQMGS